MLLVNVRKGLLKASLCSLTFTSCTEQCSFLDAIFFNVIWAQCKIKNNVDLACLVQHILIRPLL